MGLQASNPTSNEDTSESERILLITLYQKNIKFKEAGTVVNTQPCPSYSGAEGEVL